MELPRVKAELRTLTSCTKKHQDSVSNSTEETTAPQTVLAAILALPATVLCAKSLGEHHSRLSIDLRWSIRPSHHLLLSSLSRVLLISDDYVSGEGIFAAWFAHGSCPCEVNWPVFLTRMSVKGCGGLGTTRDQPGASSSTQTSGSTSVGAKLHWDILPHALSAVRQAEQAALSAKDEGAFPNRARPQKRRKPSPHPRSRHPEKTQHTNCVSRHAGALEFTWLDIHADSATNLFTHWKWCKDQW